MAKKEETNETESESILSGDVPPDHVAEGAQIDRLPVVIHGQYIKDVSFENPNAPMPLRRVQGKPDINVDFSMDARKLNDLEDYPDAYEVTLKVNVHAQKGDKTSFLIELEYGMAVSLQDVPEDRVHPLLLIEMPHYLFPFVRQLVAEMTQSAGYMPMYLSPVNFKALYRRKFGGPAVKEHGKKESDSAEDTAQAKETA